MSHQFFGNDHSINLEEAKKMIQKFKNEKDNIMKAEHAGKHLLPTCESFDRAAFDALLRREDCKGVRIYYGMRENDLRVHAVIVAFDAEGKDILPVENSVADSTDPQILDKGLPCPDYCPDSSGLTV